MSRFAFFILVLFISACTEEVQHQSIEFRNQALPGIDAVSFGSSQELIFERQDGTWQCGDCKTKDVDFHVWAIYDDGMLLMDSFGSSETWAQRFDLNIEKEGSSITIAIKK